MASKKDKNTGRKTSSTTAKTATSSGTVEKVTKAFFSKVARMRELLTASRKRGAKATYVIACGVRDVLDGSAKYGSGAAQQLEAELGMDKTTLYRWAAVARAWPKPSAFTKIVSRVNTAGLSVSWSHLELVTEVTAGDQRDALLKEALEKCFSVQALRDRIAELKGKRVNGSEAATKDAGASDISRQAKILEDEHARLSEALGRLPGGPLSPEQVKPLKRLRESCVAIAEAIEARLATGAPNAQAEVPQTLKLMDNG
jgi:hypothetical protein